MEYSKLDEGFYNRNPLNEEKIWQIFIKIFNKKQTVKVASYKYGLIHSILTCLRSNKDELRFNFLDIFNPFCKIYWNLIVKHKLYQISAGTLSSVYKIFTNYLVNNPKYRNADFETIPTEDKEVLISEVIKKCSRNVFGALFGDSDEYFYSFSKKESYIEINPHFLIFLQKYFSIIQKVNSYEWLKFLQEKNQEASIPISVFELENNPFIQLDFEEFWSILRETFTTPTTIFTLKQQKANEILEINENGIHVKTEKGTELVKIELIKKAWENLIKDGVLYRDEHEKSTYRSSFILSLFSQFDFIEASLKARLSIKLKVN
jgi:hypothetical protein